MVLTAVVSALDTNGIVVKRILGDHLLTEPELAGHKQKNIHPVRSSLLQHASHLEMEAILAFNGDHVGATPLDHEASGAAGLGVSFPSGSAMPASPGARPLASRAAA